MLGRTRCLALMLMLLSGCADRVLLGKSLTAGGAVIATLGVLDLAGALGSNC